MDYNWVAQPFDEAGLVSSSSHHRGVLGGTRVDIIAVRLMKEQLVETIEESILALF